VSICRARPGVWGGYRVAMKGRGDRGSTRPGAMVRATVETGAEHSRTKPAALVTTTAAALKTALVEYDTVWRFLPTPSADSSISHSEQQPHRTSLCCSRPSTAADPEHLCPGNLG
jgi:hypothetical protein